MIKARAITIPTPEIKAPFELRGLKSRSDIWVNIMANTAFKIISVSIDGEWFSRNRSLNAIRWDGILNIIDR